MKTFLFTSLLILSFFCQAQVTERNLLGNRYSLEAVRSALIPLGQWKPYPKTSEEWQQALPDSLRTRLIKLGEEAAAKEFLPISASLTLEYVRNGDRNNYQKVSFGKRQQLIDLAIAESIEGKGRFAEALMNGIWSICEESFWGVPAHLGTQKAKNGLPDVEDRTVDLFAAETAAVLALADYLAGDQLDKISPLIRSRIYQETKMRIFEPIREPNRYGYLKQGTKVNNWNPWIMANWLTATLLLEKDESRRSEMMYAAMKGLDLYINGLGDEGGCDEGPGYWFVAGACVFDALELLHSATNGKIQVYQEPIIRNMASYIYKMHIDGQFFVDFADADPTLNPDGLMLYRFGKEIRDATLANFGLWGYHTFGPAFSSFSGSFNRQRKIQNLLTVKEVASKPAVPYKGVKTAWFPDVQVMTARSDKGLYVATHGGHNAESHNHNDVGDFILYADGHPVIIDVGRGTYTAKTFSAKRYQIWYNQSEYHNLPIINGIGQKEGRPFEAQQVKYTSGNKTTSLSMDIAKAYPAQAHIQSWQRTVTLNRGNESVEITDAFTLTQTPSSLQQSFLSVCPVITSKAGHIIFETPSKRNIMLAFDPKVWEVRVETIPLTTPEDESLKTKWFGKTIQRILLSHKSPAASGKMSYTFTRMK